jgi:hypothetical protein
MRNTSAACARLFWSGMGKVVGCVMLRAGINAPSSSITGSPGRSVLNLMISLCPGCHAKVHRTRAVLTAMPPLLLKIWREQHPKEHEQTILNFSDKRTPAKHVHLFDEELA